MKGVAKAALLSAILLSPAYAVELIKLDEKGYGIDFGIQYRVMYNNSNIGSDKQYDFFNQRLRLNFDVKTEKGVGGFLQIEYKGPWGNVASFPHSRLVPQGIRYGYLYFPAGPGTVLAGILPANDQVDQMLFSADWDLNVGGIAYAGKVGDFDYRLAYVRLVEGAFYGDKQPKDKDQNFLVLDLNSKLGGLDVGIHFYGTYGKICLRGNNCTPSDFFTLNQTWVGPTLAFKLDPITLHGVVLVNSGKVANTSNSGWLARLEGSTKLGPANLSLLGVFSTGKDNRRGFRTVHNILGTAGYWAYTYIFTPHGPSDVNDFGLEPGNRGFGLTTLQAKADFPIMEGLSAQGVAGTFMSNKDMIDNNGNNVGKSLGTEVGVTFTTRMGKHMNLEFGGAVASLGNAGKAIYNGGAKKSVNELFARLQLEF